MDFNSEKTWQNYDPEGHVRIRLDKVQEMIPDGVRTILDVGCGNGIITNALAGDYDVTGIDPSLAALEHVPGKKALAAVEAIPFPDSSFDLVSCNQVLEHLDDKAVGAGIRELKRVARTYLLIGVPHREQLEKKLSRCASCGHTSHVDGHLQSLDLADLDSFFLPGFERLRHSIFGIQERDSPPLFLAWKHRLGQWFEAYPDSVCPKCGSSDFLHKSNLLTKLINAVNVIVTKPRPYWLLALYKKK
ncbi:MAG: class I SAM-dependent methyltransferase [Candidatus Syntrophosphaera sp.]